MAEAQNIQAILAALQAAKAQTATTPSQGQNPYAIPGYPTGPTPPAAYGSLPVSAPHQPAPPYATNYPIPPQSSTPGGYDLSAIRPVTSGTLNLGLQDAIAQAKSYATEKGLTPYERSAQDPHSHDSRAVPSRHYRSRSRSPPARRDNFRDNVNPYRDERRNDRGTHAREWGPNSYRDRSESPDDTEIIPVESSLVGLIIGRQGENLRRVESETTCRVQFMSPTGDSGGYRQCKITGPRARRAEAKAAIERIIEDSGMGALARAGVDKHHRREAPAPSPGTLRDGEDCLKIMVPDRTVGLIIGRGGETIRDLQERSGCHINIVGEEQSVDGLRPVNLIGPPHSAAQAKELILEIVASDSRNGDNNNNTNNNKARAPRPDHSRDTNQGATDKVNDSIYVPSEAVGMIIGKGGETIRDMQNTTGCKINVTASSGPGEVQREIGLVGSQEAIGRAKHAIRDKVEAVRQKNSGGGGGGGSGGGRQDRPPRNQQRRDWDNPNYSQQSTQSSQPAAPGDSGAAGEDPYAAYGGYQNYMAWWWHQVSQQQQPKQGEAPKPPGA
ncbi:hypothetical protein M426DRAFT_25501 [Hypoxylon sp. CI-4A]|nr:hypothetical protein M426DRAFT_25501 [Hypoxylon sp. CI-4A]